MGIAIAMSIRIRAEPPNGSRLRCSALVKIKFPYVRCQPQALVRRRHSVSPLDPLVGVSIPVDEPACGLRLLHVKNLAVKPGDPRERRSLLKAPGSEPRKIVAAVPQERTCTYNVNGAGGLMDEGNPHLAGALVSDEDRNVRPPVPIKVATLVEGVHAIVPFILGLELSTECLESPRRHIPHSVGGESISRLPE